MNDIPNAAGVPERPSSQKDEKLFLSAQRVHDMAEELGFRVAQANFRPTFLMAVWRGGCPAGMVVQEFLSVAQQSTIDHIASRTVSRDPVTGAPLPGIVVHATGHAIASLTPESRLLIVDDVWDSGRSIDAILAHLERALGDRMPREVKVATLFYKPKRNKSKRVPDFFVEESDDWLVFPHELEGLSEDEIAKHRPGAAIRLRALKEKKGH